MNLQPVLSNELITIRPLKESDFNALFSIASDKLIWEQHPNNDRYKEDVFKVFFEKALAIIQQKYQDKIDVFVTENVPYNDYINRYNQAHIVLDQLYGHDQGSNALEAMAKGKREVLIGGKELLAVYMKRFLPRLFWKIIPKQSAT